MIKGAKIVQKGEFQTVEYTATIGGQDITVNRYPTQSNKDKQVMKPKYKKYRKGPR